MNPIIYWLLVAALCLYAMFANTMEINNLESDDPKISKLRNWNKFWCSLAASIGAAIISGLVMGEL